MVHDIAASERQALIESLQDFSLIYLAQLKNAGGRAFDSLGLTYGQAMLITFVSRGYTTPTELVKMLKIVPPALSATITHLEGEGLIKRKSIAQDARRVCVELTPRGREAYRRIKEAWQEHAPVDLQAFNDQELRILIEAARIATRQGMI